MRRSKRGASQKNHSRAASASKPAARRAWVETGAVKKKQKKMKAAEDRQMAGRSARKSISRWRGGKHQ